VFFLCTNRLNEDYYPRCSFRFRQIPLFLMLSKSRLTFPFRALDWDLLTRGSSQAKKTHKVGQCKTETITDSQMNCFLVFFFYSRRQPQNFKRNFLALSSLINVGRRPKGVHYSMFCCGCRRCYHCFICSDFNLGTQRTQDDLGHGISGGNGGGGGGGRRRQWAWCLMGNNHSMGMEIRILLGRH